MNGDGGHRGPGWGALVSRGGCEQMGEYHGYEPAIGSFVELYTLYVGKKKKERERLFQAVQDARSDEHPISPPPIHLDNRLASHRLAPRPNLTCD